MYMTIQVYLSLIFGYFLSLGHSIYFVFFKRFCGSNRSLTHLSPLADLFRKKRMKVSTASAPLVAANWICLAFFLVLAKSRPLSNYAKSRAELVLLRSKLSQAVVEPHLKSNFDNKYESSKAPKNGCPFHNNTICAQLSQQISL